MIGVNITDDRGLVYVVMLAKTLKQVEVPAERVRRIHNDQFHLGWREGDVIGSAIDVDERFMRFVHLRDLTKRVKGYGLAPWRVLLDDACDGPRCSHRAISTVSVRIASDRSSFKPCISLQEGWAATFVWEGPFVAPSSSIKLYGAAGGVAAKPSGDSDVGDDGGSTLEAAAIRDAAAISVTPRADDESHYFFPLLHCRQDTMRRQQGRNRQKRQAVAGNESASSDTGRGCRTAEEEKAFAIRAARENERLIHAGQTPAHLAGPKHLLALEARLMLAKLKWARETQSGPWQDRRAATTGGTGVEVSTSHIVVPHSFVPCLLLRTQAAHDTAAAVAAAAASAEQDATTARAGFARMRTTSSETRLGPPPPLALMLELELVRTERVYSDNEMYDFLRKFCACFCVQSPTDSGSGGDPSVQSSPHVHPFRPSVTDAKPLAEGLWSLRADRVNATRAKEIVATLVKVAHVKLSSGGNDGGGEAGAATEVATASSSSSSAAASAELRSLQEPLSNLRRLSLASNFDDANANGSVADAVTFAQATMDYLESDLAARLEEVSKPESIPLLA